MQLQIDQVISLARSLPRDDGRGQLLCCGLQCRPSSRAIRPEGTGQSLKAVNTLPVRTLMFRGQVTTGKWPSDACGQATTPPGPPAPAWPSCTHRPPNQPPPPLCSVLLLPTQRTTPTTMLRGLPVPRSQRRRSSPKITLHPKAGDPHPTDGRWGFPDSFLDAPLPPPGALPAPCLSSSPVSQRFLLWAPRPRGHE